MTSPSTPQGTAYFEARRQALFNRARRDGTWFEAKDRQGYRYNGREFLTQTKGRVIVGPGYKPQSHGCGVPPWESCRPDCERAFRVQIVGAPLCTYQVAA